MIIFFKLQIITIDEIFIKYILVLSVVYQAESASFIILTFDLLTTSPVSIPLCQLFLLGDFPPVSICLFNVSRRSRENLIFFAWKRFIKQFLVILYEINYTFWFLFHFFSKFADFCPKNTRKSFFFGKTIFFEKSIKIELFCFKKHSRDKFWW